MRFLLTSFDIWEPHHRTNASDDLLGAMLSQQRLPAQSWVLRRLPVDYHLAPTQVIDHLHHLAPDMVVCCGMAERQQHLALEVQGRHDEDVRRTSINLSFLASGLRMTRISYDAGRFVCNHLYYRLLQHIEDRQLACQCLFVHVPPLTAATLPDALHDFSVVLHRLQPRRQVNLPLLASMVQPDRPMWHQTNGSDRGGVPASAFVQPSPDGDLARPG